MSKEVTLLELVLDNFSHIQEVLNARSEIEQCLSKLTLNKKVKTTSNVLEKVKNLVDSLYDHSVTVKDEFYKYYNKLESVLVDKEAHEESNDSIIEENTDSAVQKNNKPGSSDAVEALGSQNTKDCESDSIITNYHSCDSNRESEVDDKNRQTEVDNRDHESEEDDSNCEKVVDGRDHESEVDQSNNNVATKSKHNVDDTSENEADNVAECNGIGEHKEVTTDEGAEETNGSEVINSVHDPLEIAEESADIIDSSILDNSNTRKDSDTEKESLVEDKDKSCEDATEITKEPKIWLVDLNKLIDRKPKESVKFDSSVIILTSSDEESKTSKKKNNTKDKNAKLKSALKISNESRTRAGIKGRNDKKQLKKVNWGNESDSEQSRNSSSDSEIKVVDTLDEKNKTKKITKVEKGKSLLGESKPSSDSRAEERHVKKKNKSVEDTTKSKHSKKDESSSDSGKSDDEPITKRKKTSKHQETKSKQQSSDSSDCVIQDDSEPENTSKNESPEINSRRSSRLHGKQHQKQTRKASLRNLFQRKPNKPVKSNSEAVSKKLVDKSDSESDTDSRKRKSSKSPRKKNNKPIEHLSDTSSLSDDENENVELKKQSKKSNKRKCKDELGDVEDKKFTWKVHIPLPRIECERLKEIYKKNKEILEIKRLRNVSLPKSSKRSHKNKSDSKSSSDTEKPKSKKSKNATSTKPASDGEQSSDDDSLKDPLANGEDANEKAGKEQKQVENADDRMAEIVMDKMRNSGDDKKAEEISSESEEEKNKSDKQKETEKKSEKKKAEQEDKPSDAEDKKSENEANEDVDDDEKKESDEEKRKAKKKWRSDKLLTGKIDSTDSEGEFSKFCKKKEKSREEIMRKTKKRAKKTVLSSDSDDSAKDKNETSDDTSDRSERSNSGSDSEKDEEKEKKKPVRRRIKRTKGSSSSSDDDKSTRKQIRRVIGKDSLSETTKQAEAEEKERKARIAEKQKKYNQTYESAADSKVDKVVLDYDKKGEKELLSVNKKIVKKLKPHQASGVQFMWDTCFESLERAKTAKGSGCIVAHCMGLGKTLQVITLVHTLLTNRKETKVNNILVVCPVNTVLNWKAEFKKWLPKNSEIEVYELVSCKQNYERQYCIKEWHSDGGVLIIGYAMFRNLSNPDNKRISKKMRTAFQEGLVDPGPDMVVCDEGHLLKNEKTHLSIAMNRIKTSRRIVLTGTPLQNNLKEYWCMVQFIKPNLLGTYKEYLNRFVNPIINGQYTDSTQHDILLMRKRSHVLHKLLDGVVQRRDYSVLEPYLPPKHEYVLFVSLTETQVKMYKHYMERFARQNDGSNRTSFLFTDFQVLQRICTHPRAMLYKTSEKKEKEYDEEEESEGSLKDFIDDGDESSSSSSGSSSKSGSDSEDSRSDKKEKKPKRQQKIRITRAQAAQRRENDEESDPEVVEIRKEWWQEYCDGEELDNINNSGKLFLLFQILKECEDIGDKMLVFSQSLYTLNCIEYFLEKIDEATQAGTTEKVGGHSGSWSKGLDYFRLDGSSSCDSRASWCDQFNNPDNVRGRLFLISTKAGGLGINLVAANRVIIFDVSWNPSHDTQSIYRVYRFGQTKPCYIYRFVTYGTMEMKIYERQVTKQAISKRVIDEQQIDRHYNQNDLQELYTCDLEPTDRPIPLVPKDVLLGELLQKHDKTIYKYHLHQSLLENKADEGLNEDERKAAWEEFENEKVLRKNTTANIFNSTTMNAQNIAAALASIVRKDNPGWSEVQIRGIIPALVQQLQVQLNEGDMTMYARVQQEMQIMQALQAQKLKEAYFQQQVMRMINQQQQQAKMVGNLNVNPAQLARPQGSVLSRQLAVPPLRFPGPSSAPPRQSSSDVIELND